MTFMAFLYTRVVRLVLTLALGAVLVSATAGAAELSAQAREPFDRGMRAASQRDWTLALREFKEAQKLEPEAPEIWFNLGLASSRIPGYEIRAIALFKAYLLANPGVENAAAIRKEVAALEAGFEGKATEIADQLESLLKLQKVQGSNMFTASTGWYLGSIRYLLGDASGASRTLRDAQGKAWRETWQQSKATGSTGMSLVVAMAAAGLFDEAMGLAAQAYDQEMVSFLLEQGEVDRAREVMKGGTNDGWPTIACLAYHRNDDGMLSDALTKGKGEVNDLLGSGRCERDLWWSVGRIPYLLRIGTEGIAMSTSFNETQLVDFIKSCKLDEAHYGHSTSNLTYLAYWMEKVYKEYRKVHGPKSARDDYAEAYYYRGNLYYEKGRYDLAIRNYDHALALNPDYAEAADSRDRAAAELSRPATPEAR